MQTLLEEVNKPDHYRGHESGIEAIEITRNLPNDLGNSWKYLMRYEDKGTPKKDLLKSVWYINDYTKHFIDDNWCVTNEFKVSSQVLCYMEEVIYAEPNEQVKEMFHQIYSICLSQGILNPTEFKAAIDGINTLAETF